MPQTQSPHQPEPDPRSCVNVTAPGAKTRRVIAPEGVAIDLWETSSRIRAVYMCDGGDPSVLTNSNRSTTARPACGCCENYRGVI
jgi:hypothetical protein